VTIGRLQCVLLRCAWLVPPAVWAGWWLPGMGGSRAGCLIAVAWLLRQREDAITVQELAGLCRTACRTPAGR
jgi:hypothetical protein